MPTLRDQDLRLVLNATLARRHAAEPDTLIREEMGICAGTRRIDVAVVNGELAGFEIKSDVDTLARFLGQANAYAQVVDRATVVTTERHHENAVLAIPEWWGVLLAVHEGRQVALVPVREALPNPAVDPFAVAQLLWRDEALEELRQRGLARGLTRKARHYVWMALAEAVPIAELKQVARERLKARRAW